jgi:hypothetical protein
MPIIPRPAHLVPCLPIDLVEPCTDRHEGDRVPCHLFMPDVVWPRPLGPILRSDVCLQHASTDHVRPDLSTDLLEAPAFGAALVTALPISLAFWLVLVLLVSSGLAVLP